jgi:hypothetical protein
MLQRLNRIHSKASVCLPDYKTLHTRMFIIFSIICPAHHVMGLHFSIDSGNRSRLSRQDYQTDQSGFSDPRLQ